MSRARAPGPPGLGKFAKPFAEQFTKQSTERCARRRGPESLFAWVMKQ